MSTTFEIPLSPQPQTFIIALAGVSYTITVKWNVPGNCWVLDLGDANNNAIISGIPLIAGADLFGQYAYLNLGGSLIATTDSDIYGIPSLTDIGDTGHLYFITS